MKKLLHICIVFTALLLVGCVNVPTSKLRFAGASADLPKDFKADSIEVLVVNGPNSMTFRAKGISTQNNPEVINASTDQLKTVIEAYGASAGNLAGEIAKHMAKP